MSKEPGAIQYLLGRQENGLPNEGGEVAIGRMLDDGLGVAWQVERFRPVTVVETKNGSPWRVHLHHRALSKMQAEAGRWSDAETGGVLMGRLSEVSRVAHVVDVLDAPEDSERSAGEFILGTEGLRRRLEDYSTAVDGRSTALEHGTATCLRAAHRPLIGRRRERCRCRAWRRRYS